MRLLTRLGAILVLVALFWPVPVMFLELGSLAMFGKLLLIQSAAQAVALLLWPFAATAITGWFRGLIRDAFKKD